MAAGNGSGRKPGSGSVRTQMSWVLHIGPGSGFGSTPVSEGVSSMKRSAAALAADGIHKATTQATRGPLGQENMGTSPAGGPTYVTFTCGAGTASDLRGLGGSTYRSCAWTGHGAQPPPEDGDSSAADDA